MKDYKLISSGANGKLYYAMYSALDKLKEFVEFADRVYIIDEGKNYIWTGSQFVEDLNPIDHDDDSESGGGSEPLLVTITGDADTYTLNKTWKEIKDAFPNVALYYTYTDEQERVRQEYIDVTVVGTVAFTENDVQYFIHISEDSLYFSTISLYSFDSTSEDGNPSAIDAGQGD